MGADVSIYAVKGITEEWKKHKAVWDACEAAGVDVPDETDDFFDGEDPAEGGTVEHIGMVDPGGPGTYVKIEDLPKGTTAIRLTWGY